MAAIKGNKTRNDFGLSVFVDMFDIDEIKEIADYLIVYYETHKREIKRKNNETINYYPILQQ